MRLVALSALGLWVGTTLMLSRLRWWARIPLSERLRPYAPGGMAGRPRRSVFALETFAETVAPLSRSVGERVARVLGVSEQLEVRLRRIHAPMDVTGFRVRQIGWSLAGFGAGALVAAAVRPPLLVALLLMLGAPLLAFLVLEQQVAAASERWRRQLFLELPVISEQLAMLLSAGFSLTAAVNRVAARGRGCCAADLRRVGLRIQQGLSDVDALREWQRIAALPAVDRLVPVLALNRETADLGRLLSNEARALRQEVHRELVAAMQRRGQQVWIPVTVATLLPGVIFLAIPFLAALRFFAG
ncbi:MAG: type II secretion system F family protein [Egibacteraceae bacterium]